MTTENQLLPCPFCGSEPTDHAIEPHSHSFTLDGFKMPDHKGSHVIECKCGAGFVADTLNAATALWNARAALTQPAQPAEGGEAVKASWWMRETEDGFEWTDTAPLVRQGWTPLYTAPPASHVPEADFGNTPPASQEPKGLGMGTQALAGELAEALNKDTQSENSLGMLGQHTMAWLRQVAAEYLRQPASQEQAQQPSAQAWANETGLRQIECPSCGDLAVAYDPQQPSGGEVPGFLLFSQRKQIADDAGVQATADTNAVIAATLRFLRERANPKPEPMTEHQRGNLAIEQLGPAALAGDKMSPLDAFTLGIEATERFYGITKGEA